MVTGVACNPTAFLPFWVLPSTAGGVTPPHHGLRWLIVLHPHQSTSLFLLFNFKGLFLVHTNKRGLSQSKLHFWSLCFFFLPILLLKQGYFCLFISFSFKKNKNEYYFILYVYTFIFSYHLLTPRRTQPQHRRRQTVRPLFSTLIEFS